MQFLRDDMNKAFKHFVKLFKDIKKLFGFLQSTVIGTFKAKHCTTVY